MAQKAVNDNFPGEFGSERLVQEVVDRLLAVTATRENMEQVTGLHPTDVEKVQSSTSETTPTKDKPGILYSDSSNSNASECMTL